MKIPKLILSSRKSSIMRPNTGGIGRTERQRKRTEEEKKTRKTGQGSRKMSYLGSLYILQIHPL
jgi:hypothetical protein